MIQTQTLVRVLTVATYIACPTISRAHFSWLAKDADGNAVYFFGESIAERTYHMPDALAD
jgi:hypothetical protein